MWRSQTFHFNRLFIALHLQKSRMRRSIANRRGQYYTYMATAILVHCKQRSVHWKSVNVIGYTSMRYAFQAKMISLLKWIVCGCNIMSSSFLCKYYQWVSIDLLLYFYSGKGCRSVCMGSFLQHCSHLECCCLSMASHLGSYGHLPPPRIWNLFSVDKRWCGNSPDFAQHPSSNWRQQTFHQH